MFSLVLAFASMWIVFTLIGGIPIIITISWPSIAKAILPIFVIGALILAIITWIIIFRKSYKYLDDSFNEVRKLSSKESILIILLIVFGLLSAAILTKWAEKLIK